MELQTYVLVFFILVEITMQPNAIFVFRNLN